MTKWEYARLESRAAGVNVVFTHRKPWGGIGADAFFDTLRKLGDEGWELVAAMPLSAEIAAQPAARPEAPPDQRNQRDHPDADAAAPLSAASAASTLQVSTDRWLLFKRPQPEPQPGDVAKMPADMIKGIVGKQLLKGRLPLP